jgi:hypothetical protein
MWRVVHQVDFDWSNAKAQCERLLLCCCPCRAATTHLLIHFGAAVAWPTSLADRECVAALFLTIQGREPSR